MTDKTVPDELKRIIDQAAGREHSTDGAVMTCLAAVVAKVRADERAKVAEEIRAIIHEDEYGHRALREWTDRHPTMIGSSPVSVLKYIADDIARGDQCTCGDPDNPEAPRGPIGTCPVHDPEV